MRREMAVGGWRRESTDGGGGLDWNERIANLWPFGLLGRSHTAGTRCGRMVPGVSRWTRDVQRLRSILRVLFGDALCELLEEEPDRWLLEKLPGDLYLSARLLVK